MSDTSASSQTRHRLLLLFIIVIGVALRCYSIHESLWLDELHTAWTVSDDGSALADRARLGNNSPLYFILVRVITDSFGLQEWTLRVVSVVAGCLLIPATYFVVKNWQCSPSACLLAAGLIAMDRNAIYFAADARTYGLAQLVALVHLFLFSRLLVLEQTTWNWICWVITGIGLFHLHCTTSLVFAAEAVAYGLLFVLRRELKLHWLFFLIGMVIIGLAMLPALGLLRQLAEQRNNWALFVAKSRNPLNMLGIYPLYAYALAPLAVGLLLNSLRQLRIKQTDASPPPPRSALFIPVVILSTWILIPIVAAWMLTELDIARLFYRRYLVASGIALSPLAGVLFSWSTRDRTAADWGAVIVLSVAVATISPARYLRYGAGALAHTAEDWRTPIRMINQHRHDMPVILYSGLIEADEWYRSQEKKQRDYCEFPVRSIYRLDDQQQVIVLPTTIPISLTHEQQQRVRASGAWLLMRGRTAIKQRVTAEVSASLADVQVVESHEFGNITLLRILAENSEPP